MIWFARFPVLLAAATSMWFNGSYAYSKADLVWQQAGLVAMALAIDLVKCSFLPAAAEAWQANFKLRSLTFVMLWMPAFAFSTFCGFAAVTSNRHASTAVVDGQAANRTRLEARLDSAQANLATAKTSPAWSQTFGCTTLRTQSHRDACATVGKLQAEIDDLVRELGSAPQITSDPDLKALEAVLPIRPEWTLFLVAFVPALILELAASLGAYAVSPRSGSGGPQTPSRPSRRWWRLPLSWRPKTSPQAQAGAPAAVARPAAPRLPRLPR